MFISDRMWIHMTALWIQNLTCKGQKKPFDFLISKLFDDVID